MIRPRVRALSLAAIAIALNAFMLNLAGAEETSLPPMRISIDVRDLPRKLVHATLKIPITPATESRKVALWYPKWVPGSHGPGGPIANIAGLTFQDENGNALSWTRTPGEVCRFEVDVPAAVNQLRVALHYIADQPTTTSFGHDCFGGSQLGVINASSLLLYPEGTDIDQQEIIARIRIPKGWDAASALRRNLKSKHKTHQVYSAATLRTLVDSPIMFGKHYRQYNLVEDERQETIPPHTFHVFGDEPAHTEVDAAIVEKFRSMVTQSALLIGSHPFERFDILLAISDELPPNGLEHSRSTFNVLAPNAMASLDALKGWNRLLIPHEYLHAWCGKFRRPAGMVTSDFHTPKDTQLLWVYEGLTQYLGELVEARSGLMSPDEFRHRLNVELRNAMHLQGRRWRTLADTAAASHILRDGSPSWSGLRRSQDYYMEGMLFWLEADARIRAATEQRKSLDDFCQSFLGSRSNQPHPSGFERQNIVDELSAIVEFDWNGLIRRRVESVQTQFDPSVADLLGYDFQLTRDAPDIPSSTFRQHRGVDALDSLGIVMTQTGQIRNLLLGSPADRARLGPDMTIVGVNGRKWSGPRLIESLNQAEDRTPIELLVANGDELRSVQLHYHKGPRYWSLKKKNDSPDSLADILKAK